jgi:hypothetical protein
MVAEVVRNGGDNLGNGRVIDLELALVDVRDSGVEFLWNHPIQEWTELGVRMGASGRSERFVARGLVVGCRPARHGLWSISLYFTALAPGENPWPPA